MKTEVRTWKEEGWNTTKKCRWDGTRLIEESKDETTAKVDETAM
jgi:hypothetical protein